MITLVALWLGAASAADCETAYSSADLVDSLEGAVLAYSELDEVAFSVSRKEATVRLGCQDAPLLAPAVGAFHRVQALGHFLAGERPAALASFRSALWAQPEYQLRAAIAPPGGPLARLYDEAREAGEPDFTAVVAPPQVTVWVNASRDRGVSEAVPVIVQVQDPDGQMHWSGHVPAGGVLPGDAIPEAPVFEPDPMPVPVPAPVPAPVVTDEAPSTPRRKGRKAGFLIATVSTGLVAGALYGAAAGTRLGYDDNPTKQGRLLTNGLYVGSVGLGVTTVTLGILTVSLP